MVHKKAPRGEDEAQGPLGQYLSTFEAARVCGVSTFSIQRWFDEGLLKGARLPGGKRKIEAVSLRGFMAKHGLLPQGSPEAARPRVLLVSTDARLVQVMESELAKGEQALVRTASTGLGAALSLTEFRPSVVVFDVSVGGLPAAALVGKLGQSVHGRDARLVVLVDKPTPGLVKELKASGAAAVLAKPFQLAEFFQALALRRKAGDQ